MQYGVSYYPEHKTPDELEHDLRMLKESGINTVRMGEFAWCRMEPVLGEFHFEWLKSAAKELYKAGIKTVFCTPTACPPAWMIEKNPEILYVDNRGVTRPFGGRRLYCYNNETFREHSQRITEALAKEFGDKPYTAGFQIDNEPAQEGTGRCHCAVCRTKFTAWLADKYQTINEYNRRSGSIFWSQEYDSFDQIQMPVNTIETGAQDPIKAYYENPTLRLDYERFCSESQKEYQDLQAEILHRYSKAPVSTNGTGLATNSIDYYDSTKNLDCYGFDLYPSLRDSAVDSFPYAFARGIKDGAPFWVLEFMSGGGHRLSGSGRQQPNPGALQQAVLQQFAHGASMSLHFQYRSYPFGAEQLNYAIVDLDGVPRRRYYEMKETALILKKLEVMEKAGFDNQTALLFDYDSFWAMKIKPANDPELTYDAYMSKLYNSLGAIGVNADVISYAADFSKYRFIILSTAFVMTKKMQEKCRQFVENGGTLLMTFLSSVKNEDNIGYTTPLPAGLNEVFGVVVEEVEPVFANNHTKVKLISSDTSCTDSKWSELLSGKALAEAVYTEDYKAGSMVISKHAFGKGMAYYLGTDLEEAAMRELLGRICEQTKITKNPFIAEDKVEIVRRVMNDKEYYCIFNFTSRETKIAAEVPVKDLLTGEALHSEIVLKRNGFLFLEV